MFQFDVDGGSETELDAKRGAGRLVTLLSCITTRSPASLSRPCTFRGKRPTGVCRIRQVDPKLPTSLGPLEKEAPFFVPAVTSAERSVR